MDLIRRVLSSKSDYYKALGVESSASPAEIKKAYRKAALKLHPDKNTTPGAREAFTVVQKAYDCLSDPGKRRSYDSVGFDREDTSLPSRGPSMHTVSPEDIFEAMFGGVHRRRRGGSPFGASYRTYSTGGMGGRRGGSPFVGSDGASFSFNLAQLLPLLFVFFMLFASSVETGASDPVYSLFRTAEYSIPRYTLNHKIVYFVKPSFDADVVGASPGALHGVEQKVSSAWHAFLAAECRHQTHHRERLLREAGSNTAAAQKARAFTATACAPRKLNPSIPLTVLFPRV